MKNLLLVLMTFTIAFSAHGQDDTETLISGDIKSGGYGGPAVKIGQINGENGVFVGGQGGWIINHQFVLGGGGYGLTNDILIQGIDSPEDLYLNFGYGGLFLEYIIAPKRLIHFTVNSMIGAGGVSFRDKDYEGTDDYNNDSFFVLEPGVSAVLNLHKHVRITVGGNYRWISGVDMAGIGDSDLSGTTFEVRLKFGSF
ncbi:hypothetical protein GF337_13505 [candidate division KSB1 bacterium]|nr:hypothetical protein [candidate division KSB1 bacterium]